MFLKTTKKKKKNQKLKLKEKFKKEIKTILLGLWISTKKTRLKQPN